MAENRARDEFGTEEDMQKDRFLNFRLGEESYGIAIQEVTEIVKLQPITEIPELPAYFRGVINLRGKIIPVIDVRLRFKKPFREYDDRTCLIIVAVAQGSFGLIVDRVAEVLKIPAQEIVSPPGNLGAQYIRGIGKVGREVELILDCDRLLSNEDVKSLEKFLEGMGE